MTAETNTIPPRSVPTTPGEHVVPYPGKGIVHVPGNAAPFVGCRAIILQADPPGKKDARTEADLLNLFWEENPRALTVDVKHDPAACCILLTYTLQLSDKDVEELDLVNRVAGEALTKYRSAKVEQMVKARDDEKLRELEDRHYINLGREYALRLKNLREAEKNTKRGRHAPEIKAAWAALNRGGELTQFEKELEEKRRAAAEAEKKEEAPS